MSVLTLALAMALAGSPKAPAKTLLKLEVKPANAVVYVDGVKKGKGNKVHTVKLQPGRHVIKVVHNKDEHQEVVVVKKGETKHWQWAFEDDRMDRKLKAAEEADASDAAAIGGSGAGEEAATESSAPVDADAEPSEP